MKNTMRLFALLVLLCMAAGLVFAGGGRDRAARDGTIRVGFVMNSMAHPYTMALAEYARRQAAEMGAEVTVVDAQMDSQRQVDMIMQFIAQGFNAVMVSPVDVTSNLPAYRAARQAGVHIVEVSGNSMGDTFDLVSAAVFADQEQNGRYAAQALTRILPNGGNIVVLTGAMGSSGQIGRDKGFEDYLASRPEFVIVERQDAGWMRDRAMTLMEDMLTRHSRIDAVYGHDDIIVAGAFEAVHAARRTGITSVAVGASRDAVSLIRAGDLTATVDQSPSYEGSKGLELAVRLSRGERVDKINHTQLEIIDASNVGTFTPVW